MKNAQYNTDDVKKRCEDKLNIGFECGKEFNGWFKHEEKKIARITVPKGRKFIPPKTYHSMARQLKLTVGQFDALLDCPLVMDQYIKILKDKVPDICK